ncbi:cell division protein ZapA [Microvirga lenta]|uniref:cell division protein ZapA n=1 Tax=Microvirga lenta TaxID=2881337 RepID=UPI001CFFEF7E|nr:cell division protein ZapA [Microvirga lenta]MCB5177232.1 cell division protein ZapA [Microvirga lenta]
MSQVTVTIAGKTYRMACADGEEQHLEGLAASFDARIEEMRAAAGEIGDMRLHVMAAITLADELSEAKKRIVSLEREMDEMKRFYSAGDHRIQVAEARFAESIQRVTERIERLARSLNAPVQE